MLTLTPHHLVPPRESSALPSVVDALAVVPEDDVWLASCKSRHPHEAYARDVRHFMHALSTTIRRRLAALSSLFGHLVHSRMVVYNPVREVKRPAITRGEGLTPALTLQQARA